MECEDGNNAMTEDAAQDFLCFVAALNDDSVWTVFLSLSCYCFWGRQIGMYQSRPLVSRIIMN